MPNRPIYSAVQVAKIHAELKRRFQVSGKGTIQRIEKDLGLARDYFAHHRRGNKFDLGVLIAAIRALGDNPVEFFATALSDDDNSESGAKMPRSKRTFSGSGSSSGSDAEGRGNEGMPQVSGEIPSDLAKWFGEMDELRYDDPEKTLRELRSRADEIPEPAAVRYLAICGSTHRMMGALADARACLTAANDRLGPTDDTERAELLQRWSYIISDDGDYADALRCVERAGGIYARLGDQAGIGKALVDQGWFVYCVGRVGDAERAERQALRLLPDSLPRSRQAAIHMLGLCAERTERLTSALKHYEAARQEQFGTTSEARFLWSEARVLRKLDRSNEASTKLLKVRELLGMSNPLDGLLATAEHVQILVLLHKPHEAIEAAQSATRFIGLLQFGSRRNKVAEAAIADLCRSVTTAGADMRMIGSTIDKLKELRGTSKSDTIGDRIVRARVYRGITATQAARELKIAPPTLGAIESGRIPGRIYTLRIAAWLRSSAPELERFEPSG